MPPEPDDDSVLPESLRGTDSDVRPFWAGESHPREPDDAEVPLGEKPVPGPDDTDEFRPIGR